MCAFVRRSGCSTIHSTCSLLFFLQNVPGPMVNVVLISIFNSGASIISSIEFQAAVPKSMKVKLQPPSGRDLPAFNPLVPPTTIKQVMLICNPTSVSMPHKHTCAWITYVRMLHTRLRDCVHTVCTLEYALSLQTKVKLKYRLKFLMNGGEVLESGDVADFPY